MVILQIIIYAKDASQEVINAAVSAAKHYSLADATSPFIPAQVDGGLLRLIVRL